MKNGKLFEYRGNLQRSRFTAILHSGGFEWANHFDGPPRDDGFKAHSRQSRRCAISHTVKKTQRVSTILDSPSLPPPLLLRMLFFANQPIERDTRFTFQGGNTVLYIIVTKCNIVYNIEVMKYETFYIYRCKVFRSL